MVYIILTLKQLEYHDAINFRLAGDNLSTKFGKNLISAIDKKLSIPRFQEYNIKTLVYQSFRNFDVPIWMTICMDSVKIWCEKQSFSYRFLGDEFFTYVPEWFNHIVDGQRHLVADLARLELADHYLKEGWDRVIWVDADVLVCDPDNFIISDEEQYWFCKELWMTRRDDNIIFSERANNSITVFCKDNHFLDFYRQACRNIVRNKTGKLSHTDIGTGFLTKITDALPLIKTSVVFSHFLLVAFYRNDKKIIATYLNRLAVPIQAVNLCLTFRNSHYQDVLINDDLYLTVINNLNANFLQNPPK